jgi:alkanesulfonate monooxygenase SsuD/methylene tetrahydromethanopterin reductase-like flavin-dependent oxidoreductase (luciferase family)
MEPRTAFGVTAADVGDPARLGAGLEALGYDELWVNDTPSGDGLAALASVADATIALRLGVGVVALSEHDPADIARRVSRAGIAPERLTLGVGSGASRSLDLVRDGVLELRELLPGHAIAVAAVGPKMARLAGEISDAVVANWALPERLAELRELVAGGATSAERRPPRLVAYVRTAVGPGAGDRLRTEMARYGRAGRHYAAAFAAHEGRLVGVAVESGDPAEVDAALAPYRSACDTVVVRALPSKNVADGWLEVARAARGR